MMQASTSPFYPIIATNDVSAAMMDGAGGKTLTDASIREAVSFRKTVARINAENAARGEWFFNVWQPDYVIEPNSHKKIPFYEASSDLLSSEPSCWLLRPNDGWHGFGNIEEGYCMTRLKFRLPRPGLKPTENWKTGESLPPC